MFNKEQSQSTGNDCLAIQAGRDANINIGHATVDVERIVKASILALESKWEGQVQDLKSDKAFIEGQLAEAIRALALKSTDANESNTSKLKFEGALRLVESGSTVEAENLFLEIEDAELKSISSSTSKIIEAALNRGALAIMRDSKAAMSAYERVLSLEPNNLIAKASLARLHMRTGDYVKSEDFYLQILNFAKKTKQYEWVASAYYALGQVSFCKGNLKKSHKMQSESIKVMQRFGDYIGVFNAKIEMVHIYIEQGDLSQAQVVINKLIALSVKFENADLLARSNAVKGIIYSKLKNFLIAEEAFLLSLEYYKEKENLEGLAESYGNLGVLYKNKGDIPMAEEMYAASLELEIQLSRKSGIISDLVNIASLYNFKGEYSIALEKCKEALKLALEINSSVSLSLVYANLGSIYFSDNNFALAKDSFEASCLCEKKSGNSYKEASQLVNLAASLVALNQIDQALTCLKRAKVLARNHNDANLVKIISGRIKELSS